MPRRRRHAGVAIAVALLISLALLDFVLPSGGWYADHPMTSSAIATVVGFVAAGMFLEEWLREREARRLSRISTVAYRSLAQYANDAGRALLAPLTGADLFALGVPATDPGQAAADQERLARNGHGASFDEHTGSWRNGSRAELRDVLVDLLRDPEYVTQLFRRTAVMRRRLQEVTAMWSPVMLTSTQHAHDLGRLRDLTDAFELLQEQVRKVGFIGGPVPRGWMPDPAWIDAVSGQFWATIACYEAIRDDFGDLAALPSDAIVSRRQHGPALRRACDMRAQAQPGRTICWSAQRLPSGSAK